MPENLIATEDFEQLGITVRFFMLADGFAGRFFDYDSSELLPVRSIIGSTMQSVRDLVTVKIQKLAVYLS